MECKYVNDVAVAGTVQHGLANRPFQVVVGLEGAPVRQRAGGHHGRGRHVGDVDTVQACGGQCSSRGETRLGRGAFAEQVPSTHICI